jgi:hypothetical protein
MDTVLPTLSATAFEAIAALVSAALYLIVGVAAFARAPNDVRARVFLATALASAAPYSVTPLIWARGSAAPSATPMAIGMDLPVVIVVGLSLMLGSLTLFHFTQVFPWRRPWIRSHARWLYAGYVAVAIVAAAIAIAAGTVAWKLAGAFGDLEATGSGGLGAVSAGISETAGLLIVLVALPVLFGLGVAVPFAALWSLYKTWLAAKSAGVESARVTTYWILISQMAGGVLSILIIPLLRFVAPTGPWVTIAAVLLFACGLLMPIAFAAGVWKYRVLELDPESPPAGR